MSQNPNSILREDDFTVGLFVTVHSLKEQRQPPIMEDFPMPMPFSFGTMVGQKQSPFEGAKGVVMRIDAIDLPYLVITAFACRPDSISSTSERASPIDIREVNLKKINHEYIKTYLGAVLFEQAIRDIANYKENQE